MRKYEIMVIIDPDVDERQVPALLEKHLLVITNGKGTVDGQDIWGRRRMAYEINKKPEGIYAVLNVTAPSDVVAEMDRLMTIDEQIMRTKVMRTDKSVGSTSCPQRVIRLTDCQCGRRYSMKTHHS